MPWTTRHPPASSHCFTVSKISRAKALIASWHSIRPNFALLNPLVAKAGNENPFECSRPSFELCESLLIELVLLLFTTDCSLDLITSIDDRLENVDKVATVVADRIAESRNIIAITMALTPNHIRRDVTRADDVRIETRKIEFVDILMEADFWCENESPRSASWSVPIDL